MFFTKLSHNSIIIILWINVLILLASCRAVSNAGEIKERYKRQFYGGHGFGSFSLWPFFHLSWGDHHHPGWPSYGRFNYDHGWGEPWRPRPRFGMRRQSWRRQWNGWKGFHESYTSHESFHDHHPWFT
ncbi:unnamed protein product [Litomosoides sigmodontis]|uniref:Uncharacterized protein n=1 Tax=Litomosoides sigmodontis TaxID=42156 RepID=A0A3P6VAD3_LITSI|nr:unnamed protein product [Litomosoides sigmodontis]